MPDNPVIEKVPDGDDGRDGINSRGANRYQAWKKGEITRDEYLDEIVELVHRPLVSCIFHQSGHQATYEDQEDMFQEVLKRFIAAEPDLSSAPLMPWLFKVVRNLVIDRWRRSANHDDVALADADCIAIHPAQTREWFIDKAVHDALKSLSWECNFAIDMCFYKGYTQTEVAGMLGVPRSTIEHYVRSAMQRLRESSQIKELMGGGKTLQKEQR